MEARYGSVLEALARSDEFPPAPDEGENVVSMPSQAKVGTGGNS